MGSLPIILCCFFNFFQIHFGIVYIWPMYYRFNQRIWFTVIFFLSKRAAFCSKHKFSLLDCHIFCPSSCYHKQNYQNSFQLFWWRILTKSFAYFINSIFIWPSHKVCLFEKFVSELKAFQIILKLIFLAKQLRSLKKMVVSSTKFIILFSRSPICICPCINISENCKHLSRKNA